MQRLIDYKSRFRILKGGKISLVVSSLLTASTLLNAAPTGGVVASGSANISTSGNTTNITQHTNKVTINWNKFNIASNETVNFKQPNSSSIALNRVVGNEKSIINGALNANGQVWLLNSNGILFGKSARINTAGFLGTTKQLSDSDFNAGNYNFKGDSQESVINLGEIQSADNSYVALLAKNVENDGTIKVVKGKVHLVGADDVSINLNGNSLVNLKVNKGVLDSLVKNSGAIYAKGGEIYLTTNAVNELLKGVVNNTGILEANSFEDFKGKVELFAHGGEAQVGGIINAADGFVETSGKNVKIDNNFKVSANKWLIDPVDFVIAATGGDITGATLSSNLESADVEIQSTNGSSGTDGNIYVNDIISWTANNTLTLNALNNIEINEDIIHNGTSAGGIIFLYGQSEEYGGSSSFNVLSGKSVIADSIQWRKGNKQNALRYAIVNNDIFLGNQYIEIGINYAEGGKLGSNTKPSLFYGRQGVNSGIGMIGDADGFGEGQDLRIDYFLPGTPAESFAAKYDESGSTTTGHNYALTGNNAIYELFGINNDGKIEAKVTTTLNNTLKTEQTFTLGSNDAFFNNDIVLSNVGSSNIDNVVFTRSFDPDNTSDIGGNTSTKQVINRTIASGDSENIVSASSLENGPYENLTGKKAQIFYSTSDSKSKVGFDEGTGVFFNGSNIDGMLSLANNQSKGDSITEDGGIGVIFEIGTLNVSETSSFNYKTYLSMGLIDDIVKTKVETPKVETNDVEKVVAAITQKQNTIVPIQNIKNNITIPTEFKRTEVNVISTPSNDTPTKLVSLSSLKQSKSTGDSTPTTNNDVIVPLGQNSIINLVNGGVNLPSGVEQQFFVASQEKGNN
ncbi:hypothetical protein CRU98_08405 [Arcobacter sp. CECT 8986]|uniref:two-partner secretion domain-containing protein n=1 Tax=Arcobacter sp. CECT 8986 TaxID=2044507 RepID=UPI001009C377|nr:filamentous hemagglutinin N-terminal domain-containing protein [Arcobacter sp. CECT 8986]RXJ98776.1 hypothetical protein CRU98_08405 [Arcobacter sp. CECT 8986]